MRNNVLNRSAAMVTQAPPVTATVSGVATGPADAAAQTPSHKERGVVVSVGEMLLLDAEQAAEVLGMCRAMFYRLHSAGKVPRPVRLSGKLVRWRKGELVAWVSAGCPNREQWETVFQKA